MKMAIEFFFSDTAALFYTVGVLLIACYQILRLHLSAYRVDETERRFLERKELHLANLLKLFEAPDVKLLMGRVETRNYLVTEWSDSLRADVSHLIRSKPIGPVECLLISLFFLGYYLIRVKPAVLSGFDDLRFLSGIELILCRRLNAV